MFGQFRVTLPNCECADRSRVDFVEMLIQLVLRGTKIAFPATLSCWCMDHTSSRKAVDDSILHLLLNLPVDVKHGQHRFLLPASLFSQCLHSTRSYNHLP